LSNYFFVKFKKIFFEKIGKKNKIKKMIFAAGFRKFLDDDEKVHRIFRRPFLFLLPKILSRGIFFGGAAAAGNFFFPQFFYFFLIIGIFGIYRVFCAIFFWYFNAILMTNQSVMIVNWPQFFHRKFTRIDYWNIDEISVERRGWASFFFNFGILHFQKTNGGETFEFEKINRPNKTAKIIENFREKMVDHKNFSEESTLKDLLSKMVKTHVGGDSREIFFKKNPENLPAKKFFSAEKIPQNFSEKKILEKEIDDSGGVRIDF